MSSASAPEHSVSCILMLDAFDVSKRTHFQEFAFFEREPEVELFLVLPAVQETKGIAALKKLLPPEKIFTYQSNPYQAANRAARGALGHCIFLLKAGTVLCEGALTAMIALLQKNTQCNAGLGWLRQEGVRESAEVGDNIGAMPYDYTDALYSKRNCPVLLWKKDADGEAFKETFSFLADEERVLRLAGENRLLAFTGDIGAYHPCTKDTDAQYKQLVYEEELMLKEEHIRNFFSDAVPFSDQLKARLLLHTKIMMLYYTQISAGIADIDVLEFDRQAFLYALLLAKSGDAGKAMGALYDHLKILGESRNAAHLYRVLLTPALDAPSVGRSASDATPAPLVSVVIPLYNQERYLENAIRSVLRQTETRWELLIVNDGSTDNSLHIAKELVASIHDSRIRLISHANMGKGKTRNRGVRETSAPFVCVLDADDMIAPAYFSTALDILDNDAEIGWLCPQTLVFGGNNHLTWTWEYNFFASLLQCPAPSSAVYRRSMWEEVQGYCEDMIDAEDYVFWIKAGERGWRGQTMQEVLFIYRHAFQRFGCRAGVNIKRKQQYIEKHPWWYERLPPQIMRAYLRQFQVMIFPKNMLNRAAVEKVQAAYGNKEVFCQAVDRLKADYSANHKAQAWSCPR
ncbi:MAG: glycosyltransferase family 2 protein [Deltaproteobacteria bacterium]|nr:glycosyltransferase family 2 protein [Deltaproteobacteria bacterium]